MQHMNDMPMIWQPMPGQTWLGTTIMFVAMWTMMMVAMMLPSLVPVFARYRIAAARVGRVRAAAFFGVVLLGYTAVWLLAGAAVFPLGVAISRLTKSHLTTERAVPILIALTVLVAGSVQFTRWKTHQLQCWRGMLLRKVPLPHNSGSALWSGVQLGVHCFQCSAGLTAVLLAVGISSTALMIAMTAVISFERLSHNSARAARIVGVAVVATGFVLLFRVVGTYNL